MLCHRWQPPGYDRGAFRGLNLRSRTVLSSRTCFIPYTLTSATPVFSHPLTSRVTCRGYRVISKISSINHRCRCLVKRFMKLILVVPCAFHFADAQHNYTSEYLQMHHKVCLLRTLQFLSLLGSVSQQTGSNDTQTPFSNTHAILLISIRSSSRCHI